MHSKDAPPRFRIVVRLPSSCSHYRSPLFSPVEGALFLLYGFYLASSSSVNACSANRHVVLNSIVFVRGPSWDATGRLVIALLVFINDPAYPSPPRSPANV